MPSIRIVKTPPGQAPQWVREAWIGVEIPLPRQEGGGVSMGVRGGSPDSRNRGGYQVDTATAIERLRSSNRGAAEWWDQAGIAGWASRLEFGGEFCELISRRRKRARRAAE